MWTLVTVSKLVTIKDCCDGATSYGHFLADGETKMAFF
jgi:hypothetical protein